MHFELNLAIAFACLLAISCFVLSWLVPLVFGTLVRAIAALIRSVQTAHTDDRSSDSDDWWGPTHHSH